MASDTSLLTTLCTICHAAPPKYKCPRCATRTCSLPCIQKHKARSDCDGVRNARAFVPLAQLTTPAGWDHDYNFLTSIERACERRDRELAAISSARDTMREQQQQQTTKKSGAFRKVWFGDDLHHVPAGAAIPGVEEERTREDGPRFDKEARRRMRLEGIEVVAMPRGMARQRENGTKWDRKTLSLNWTVEWLVYGVGEEGKPVRVVRRMLEGKRLDEGLGNALEWQASEAVRLAKEQAREEGEEAVARKKRTHRSHKKKLSTGCGFQDATSTAWLVSKPTLQDPDTGAWHDNSMADEINKFSGWQFFLLQAAAPSVPTKGKALIPVSPLDTLAKALSGRTVVEFPTIYVLPPGEALPDGFSLGSTERRKRKAEDSGDEGEADEASQRPRKKVTFEGNPDGPNRRAFEDRTRGKWEPRGNRGGRGGRGGRGDRGGQRGRGRGRGGHGGGNGRFERPARAHEDVEEGEIASDGEEMEVDVNHKVTDKVAQVAHGKRPRGLVDYDSSGDSE